jgi:hypothetical protein
MFQQQSFSPPKHFKGDTIGYVYFKTQILSAMVQAVRRMAEPFCLLIRVSPLTPISKRKNHET